MAKKGSFWKGNIKKIKKEKNERRIQQKAKLSRMKIEKTVFNVLKSVVADNEERQQKILQEEREEQEPAEYCRLLLDANILHDIFLANEDVITKLKNYLDKKPLWGNNLLFLTLDRLITEFINMEKYKFAEEFDYVEVCGQLSSLGKFEDVKLDYNAEFAHKARQLCESGKYFSAINGDLLSEVDCYLLEYTIEYSCKLVTRDNTLYDATKEEIRLRTDESELIGPTSPGVFNPNRT